MARKKRVEKQSQRVDRGTRETQSYGTGGAIVPLHRKAIPTILPRNVAQEDYLYQLANPDTNIVFAIGPAGTGKTLLCTQMGIKAFMEREVKKIVITRPAVSVDEQHGFLPGDLNEKMAPWTRPIFDVFREHFSNKEIHSMISESVIEISPLAYMRGRTFKDSYIIADEMQNATSNQMKMLLTRIGENSKMAVTGDLAQTDRAQDNGLMDFLGKLNSRSSNYIETIMFDQYDIERHPVVADVLRIYD